jgi:hypothetical protein
MLVFVYNAKNDFVSKTLDFAHKIISPNTYQCDLCSLTYGNFGIKKEWEVFLNTIRMDTKFMYSNQYEKLFPNQNQTYPAIFLVQNNQWKSLVSPKDFKDLQSLQQLIQHIESKLL